MAESNPVFTAAGTVLSIGDAEPGTYDKAGFEAVVWTEVGEVTDIPEFGRLYNLVQHLPLGDRRAVKRKGGFNDGSFTLQYGVADRASPDAGQTAIEGFIDSDANQAIRIVLQDTTHIYFIAQVMSNPITISTIDTIVMKSVQLEITCDILFEGPP